MSHIELIGMKRFMQPTPSVKESNADIVQITLITDSLHQFKGGISWFY